MALDQTNHIGDFMIDRFASFQDSPAGPAQACFAISPDDAAELPTATKAIYIGEAGNIVLVPLSGTAEITFANLPAGAILDVRARAVKATGTTAAALVGLA
ncbi:hypothetical protein AAG612_01130 [Citromicrobium bathyomarinum]|uniref:spike base protein, RCAP_Rcc01079 family n=1 Tax=Citromicrobium bathyomarinum TaxID=72174 RepID=UPI00315A87F4